VLADAYLDDPGWVAVGPDNRRRRHAYTRRVCRGAISIVDRWGGKIWCAERDGRVAGVLTSCDPGQRPPPQLRATVKQSLGPALAGPRVLWRSLAADAAMHKHHPEEPHFYVWMLGVSPQHQRTGVGRALLNAALELCDREALPAYLDSSKERNVVFYSRHGFRVTEELRLPDGPPIWLMWRDPA